MQNGKCLTNVEFDIEKDKICLAIQSVSGSYFTRTSMKGPFEEGGGLYLDTTYVT